MKQSAARKAIALCDMLAELRVHVALCASRGGMRSKASAFDRQEADHHQVPDTPYTSKHTYIILPDPTRSDFVSKTVILMRYKGDGTLTRAYQA